MAGKRLCIREPFSGLSHLVGAALSIAGLVLLLIESRGRFWSLVGSSIYGASLITLYSASALYHSLPVNEKSRKAWQRFDYIAIFLLIAGTYAPICLVPLHGSWGWRLLGAVYGIAALGIGMILFWKDAPHWIRITLYVAMGWLAVLALPLLHSLLPLSALIWLVAGGLVYTFGTIVYATEKPRLWPGTFGAHDLWHIFVLGGSICHFVLIACYIVG